MAHRPVAKGGAGRGTRRLPDPVARALDLSGVCGGPEFIGPGPDALQRVRRLAAILRGDLLKRRETCPQPTVEHEATGDRSGTNRRNGRSGSNAVSR